MAITNTNDPTLTPSRLWRCRRVLLTDKWLRFIFRTFSSLTHQRRLIEPTTT